MICGRERAVWSPDFALRVPESLEGLGARDFMDEMPVYIEEYCAIVTLVNYMLFEDTIV